MPGMLVFCIACSASFSSSETATWTFSSVTSGLSAAWATRAIKASATNKDPCLAFVDGSVMKVGSTIQFPSQPEVLSYHDFLFGQAQNQYIKLIQIPKLGNRRRARRRARPRFIGLLRREKSRSSWQLFCSVSVTVRILDDE